LIEQVRGRLVHKAPTFAVVDVAGVGYGLSISVPTYDGLPEIGEQVVLLTHLHVREDRLELFGFGDRRERVMFRLLIGVSGIGPHSAQMVLSGMALADLEAALRDGRVAELTAIKGIGRKTAERMILDLRDKVSAKALPGESAAGQSQVSEEGPQRQAEMALVALGIGAAVARQAVEKVFEKGGDGLTVQELIKEALRQR